jgi:hypothetical protein
MKVGAFYFPQNTLSRRIRGQVFDLGEVAHSEYAQYTRRASKSQIEEIAASW